MGNKILEVKNLKISFRTMNGKVQAVRDISFDLFEDDTLAIVGESGSGKSVTSKAILGILAGNSIVEGGEIIYDGRNLLGISEKEFCKIRGDKIAMIFQDPLSSLNPIMKVGKQLTEAMLLKGKARQKESRRTFNTYLHLIEKNMIESNKDNDVVDSKYFTKLCQDFDRFEYKHVDLERDYNFAIEARDEALTNVDRFLFRLEKRAPRDTTYVVKKVCNLVKKTIHTYVVHEDATRLIELTKILLPEIKNIKLGPGHFDVAISALQEIKAILEKTKEFETPNFFSMGYYLTYSKKSLPELPVHELNRFLREYLDENFMLNFINHAKGALTYSADKAFEGKQSVIDYLTQDGIVQKFITERATAIPEIKALVEKSKDLLETTKDSLAYTFVYSLKKEIALYYSSIVKNKREQARFAKEDAKYQRIIAKGKTPDWKVAPLSLIDLDDILEEIETMINRMVDHYKHLISLRNKRNFDEETVAMIDFLKENASGVVNHISKARAKSKAITLLEEVGIPAPRRRYNQYPFEFSGGMRQRIVIAIALAANPNILICDEPTTALDVTIQAQILELINDLKARRHLAIIFITHDLGVVANMADRIAVMYAGKIVEYGTSEEIFYSPAHPYTWALLASMPDLDTNERLEAIPGTPPNMIYPPVGDAFAERNKYALKIDFEMQPPFFKITDTHYAATWLLHKDAPHVEMPDVIKERIKRMKEKNALLDKKEQAKEAPSKKSAPKAKK